MATRIKNAGWLTPYLRKRRFDVARPFLQGRILDVGCHDGALAEYVAPDRYVGVDVDQELLAQARTNHSQHTFLDVDELDDDRRFDTVVSLAVIEHVHEPEGWLRRWSAHVEKGGHVVLTTPHAQWEPMHGLASKLHLTSVEAHDEHESVLERASAEALIAAVGLRLVAYRRFLGRMNQLIVAQRP